MIGCAFGANIEPISNHVNTTRKVTGKIQKYQVLSIIIK